MTTARPGPARPPRLLRLLAGTALALLAACSGPGEPDDGLPVLPVTVFAAPSQSLWLPTLITELGLDEKQGFRLRVNPKPGQVAYTDFATGADPVCYCANPAAVARFVQQGADITLLWNAFELDYYVITRRDDIRTLQDLHGKRLGADTSSGTWAIAAWLLQGNGVALDRVDLRSSSHHAAGVAELKLGRLDAIVSGMVDLAILRSGEDAQAWRALELDRERLWPGEAGAGVPSIAFGVWRPWLQAPGNLELARKLYRASREAADYLARHPDEAARIVSAKTAMPEAALRALFRERPDMIDIRPMPEYRDAVKHLTQEVLPRAGQLERPLTDTELAGYVHDFAP
ncbi:ABC transporter substrate-binding protein [Luteimonas sp. Y-2-2-4F]|nr:ABC transporter substrate-binding protein [Luteimonas sp. Y-2-2-4F]MCD9032667.1 ABC transporter substrate-binding protein [Luteimonas sp. Y-2-2-4F]